MRMVMVVVRTAAILSIVSGQRFIGEGGCRNYLVTMVLTASSVPVGLIMNQNRTLVMLTIQMDYRYGAS